VWGVGGGIWGMCAKGGGGGERGRGVVLGEGGGWGAKRVDEGHPCPTSPRARGPKINTHVIIITHVQPCLTSPGVCGIGARPGGGQGRERAGKEGEQGGIGL
jgi:hypothetical protein